MTIKTKLQIGMVAKSSETSIHTIRYYEKMGLIKKPSRSEGGFRVYSPDVVERILFIKEAQTFGLTLAEIKKMVACGDRGLEPCCELVAKIFENKIQEFETKINDLQKMKKQLKLRLANWAKR